MSVTKAMKLASLDLSQAGRPRFDLRRTFHPRKVASNKLALNQHSPSPRPRKEQSSRNRGGSIAATSLYLGTFTFIALGIFANQSRNRNTGIHGGQISKNRNFTGAEYTREDFTNKNEAHPKIRAIRNTVVGAFTMSIIVGATIWMISDF